MKVIALDTHDGHREGDVYEVPEHHAAKLIAKGLVKAGPVPKNKMAPPSDNKENPTRAVGADRTSSLSPAAQALPMPTVIPLDAGDSANLTREQIREVMKAPTRDPFAEFIQASGLDQPNPPAEPTPPKRRGRPPKAKAGE